ncbi:metallophosphoesterase [Planctomycetota bacterium]
MPQKTIDLLHAGIHANQQDPKRHGNVIHLPDRGSLIVSGDLHGHRRNFERIVTCANLKEHPDRHVLLQEIIHGGPQNDRGGCLSYQLILDAIRYKLDYPEQVHIILGNHDTAFICNAEVMKDGREMNRSVFQALEHEYSSQWTAVRDALSEFLFSQPLAVHTKNGLWMSHSLPADRLADQFDATIFDREITHTDLVKPGGVYILTWGRRMSQDLLDRLAKQLGVEVFILGHQPQPEGWQQAGENLIILACDHNHGCILRVDLSEPCSMAKLTHSILPLSAIA